MGAHYFLPAADGNDVERSNRLLRNKHHHHGGECAVDDDDELASSCTYAPFRRVLLMPPAASATARKRRRVEESPLEDGAGAVAGAVPLAMRRALGKVKVELDRRMAAKDAAIGMARRESDALAERLRCACAEARAWRDAAVAREAEAAALRTDLDTALRDMARRCAADDKDDAETSRCGDNFTGGGSKEEDDESSPWIRCFGCGEQASCWHLCAACAAAEWGCPACGYGKLDGLHVKHDLQL